MERSLITKHRQKKPHHHKVIGRECVGGARELVGFPQAAAEVLEGYFISWGIPLRSVGSKPQAELPSIQNQNQERNPDNIQL